MEWIKKAWRGQEKLWRVFWIYGILIGIPVGVINSLILGFKFLPVTILDYLFQIAYAIWLLVAEWRCAFNVEWRGWGYIIRGLILFSLITIPLSMLLGGLLLGKDLISLAECRQATKLYQEQGGVDPDSFSRKCKQQHGLK